MRDLQIIGPSLKRVAMAAKAVVELEIVEFGDTALLKRKRACLEEVR
jgi:hypothetical protein